MTGSLEKVSIDETAARMGTLVLYDSNSTQPATSSSSDVMEVCDLKEEQGKSEVKEHSWFWGSESKTEVRRIGLLNLQGENERFGKIELAGGFEIGQTALTLSVKSSYQDSRAKALQAILASIVGMPSNQTACNDDKTSGGSASNGEYCRGTMMSNVKSWEFQGVDYDGPRFYRRVFDSVMNSKLPVSLVGMVSSYLIPGFKMPTKLAHLVNLDFTPKDLPITIKLSQGISTHLTSGQIFWEMEGEFSIDADMVLEGYVNHRKPASQAGTSRHFGLVFRNEIKGHWNRSHFHMGDKKIRLSLLQNLTEGSDWQWDFDKVEYIQEKQKGMIACETIDGDEKSG
eukprot:CAMPEP_0114532922 /NCGR_PEP_ID=MMETSP0109-20121206/26948_1 /TAXON_ID=29199 /ORGANISM="Chlorarachnion reptans, Strain CCCM449" /LENGTH=341 /DNA_ID=CAMNT_0001716067 /DNA_START=189 /DNA_END=1214 /DNA_ORIENTATION=-